jgi:hypothetical protein
VTAAGANVISGVSIWSNSPGWRAAAGPLELMRELRPSEMLTALAAHLGHKRRPAAGVGRGRGRAQSCDSGGHARHTPDPGQPLMRGAHGDPGGQGSVFDPPALFADRTTMESIVHVIRAC